MKINALFLVLFLYLFGGFFQAYSDPLPRTNGTNSVEFYIQKDAYLSLLANGGIYPSLDVSLSKESKAINTSIRNNFARDVDKLMKNELSDDFIRELPPLLPSDDSRFSFEGTKILSRIYHYYENKLHNCSNSEICIQQYD